jgi:hypothetical protein
MVLSSLLSIEGAVVGIVACSALLVLAMLFSAA